MSVGKPCPACGERFVGLEALCQVCRRKPKVAAKTVTRDAPAPTRAAPTVTRDASIHVPATSDVTRYAGPLYAMGYDVAALVGEIVPARSVAAERQRRYRERKRGA